MTKAQKTLRDLRNRQSKERGKMAELGAAESLTDETRAELDAIEAGTPDLERQLRAATVAVETEESEQRAAGDAAGARPADGEDRERIELRSKISLAGYLSAAVEKRGADGAEPSIWPRRISRRWAATAERTSRLSCLLRRNTGRPPRPTSRPCRGRGSIGCSPMRARRNWA